MSKLTPSLLFALIIQSIPALAAATDLVRHKDVTVTEADFDAYMERVPPENRLEARASDERNRKVVELLFTNRMLARDARLAGLDKDPVLARRVEQLVESFLANQYVAYVERNAKVPEKMEARARELYLSSPAKWTEPDRIELQHILIGLHGRTREMARDLALQVRAKAVEGRDFLELAKEFSEDPGFKRDGGRLGLVSAKDLDESLAKGAFALQKNGELSEPIETRSGFHLVKRISFQRSYLRKFEDVKELIIEGEVAKIRAAASEKVQDTYRRTSDTWWNIPAIAKLRTEIPREEIARKQKEEVERLEREARERAMRDGTSVTAPALNR